MSASQLKLSLTVAMALAAGLLPVGAQSAQATPADGTVDTSGGPLNVRSGPATDRAAVGVLADGSAPRVHCKVRGQRVEGHVRTSATWLRIGEDRWISDAYVSWSGGRADLAWCAAADRRPTTAKVATDGGGLNVRAGTDTGSERVDTYQNGTPLSVQCQVWGQHIDGRVAETSVWYRLAAHRHLSAAYVEWTGGPPWLPWCGQDAPSVPSGGERGFIDAHAPAARGSHRETGVPASVTLAQAILESGWGSSALAREDHNIFGMKCFGSPGSHALGCRDYSTFECSPTGGCFDMDATFRAYGSVGDSYRDHGALLSGWSRYAEAMTFRDDPDRFAREIHEAGYATDPEYADKLIGIMQQYDLYQYDAPPLSQVSQRGRG